MLVGWLAGWREVVGWLAAGWLETLNPKQSAKDVDGTNCIVNVLMTFVFAPSPAQVETTISKQNIR